ncbi:MAG: hypothetical protein CSA94_00900 [Bacteroidetes bacterium]|nr:MAG: hypothetical protein CSA94_00900 [Bacteroidota bacterium]
MENYFNNTYLFKIFGKWKWQFIITMVISAILGVVLSSSLVITPKYKSTALLYPSNIAPYSEESETEQMLQWLQARDIKDSLIQRFNLSKHYKIDPGYKHYYSTMLWLLQENVKISKTQYESIEIVVLDKDPKMAKEMVDAIIDLGNAKIKRIHKSKYKEVVDISKNMLDMNKRELDSVNNILQNLAEKYDIYNLESQSRELMKGYLKTSGGNNAAINKKNVATLKKSMQQKSAEYLIYSSYVDRLLERYNQSKVSYEDAYKNYSKDFTYTNLITKPYISDNKAYPVRWLIMAYILFSAFLLFIIIVSILEHKSTNKVVNS